MDSQVGEARVDALLGPSLTSLALFTGFFRYLSDKEIDFSDGNRLFFFVFLSIIIVFISFICAWLISSYTCRNDLTHTAANLYLCNEPPFIGCIENCFLRGHLAIKLLLLIVFLVPMCVIITTDLGVIYEYSDELCKWCMTMIKQLPVLLEVKS